MGKRWLDIPCQRFRLHLFGYISTTYIRILQGIWLRPHPAADPCLTLFGSTNLNSRSTNLDTELSFFLATACPDLRRRLGAEVDGLRAHALPWRGATRHVRLGTRALVALVGEML